MFSPSGDRFEDQAGQLQIHSSLMNLGQEVLPEDLMCAFFHLEVKLFTSVGNILNQLKGSEFEDIWAELDQEHTGYFTSTSLDQVLLAPLTESEWELVARRLLHKPKVKIERVSRSDFKIFLQLFLPELRVPPVSHLQSSASLISGSRSGLPLDYLWLPHARIMSNRMRECRSAIDKHKTGDPHRLNCPNSAPEGVFLHQGADLADQEEVPRPTAFTLGKEEFPVSPELLSGGLLNGQEKETPPETPLFPHPKSPASPDTSSPMSSARSSQNKHLDLADLCGGGIHHLQTSKLKDLGQDWEGLQAFMSVDSNDESVQVFDQEDGLCYDYQLLGVPGRADEIPSSRRNQNPHPDSGQLSAAPLDVASLRMKYSGSADEEVGSDALDAIRVTNVRSLGKNLSEISITQSKTQEHSHLRTSKVKMHPKLAWGKKLFSHESEQVSLLAASNANDPGKARAEMKLPEGKLEAVIKENEQLIEEIGKRIASKIRCKPLRGPPNAFCYEYSMLETGKGDVQSTFAASPAGIPEVASRSNPGKPNDVLAQSRGFGGPRTPEQELISRFGSDGLKILGASGQKFKLPLTRSNNLAGSQDAQVKPGQKSLREHHGCLKTSLARSLESEKAFGTRRQSDAKPETHIRKHADNISSSHNRSLDRTNSPRTTNQVPCKVQSRPRMDRKSKPAKASLTSRPGKQQHHDSTAVTNLVGSGGEQTNSKAEELVNSQYKNYDKEFETNRPAVLKTGKQDGQGKGLPSEQLRERRAVWQFVRGLK